ncbi:efflux RND transporter periplasmic adaptor subunit [Azoarcus indigens]|uniref:Macrolide-specific efflux system membrane fusion protein n=1 Tax=Azoarcus indigens TaxID=29545 RepID=A0A4R6DU38_9RHOO|nr:efflux RND transporter periplasmic adaptor subunit [Azoarcus indigens]NMG67106.1 efflux RND transporter periplasmic adaptor subunit [Azoarcus indigens]TDN48695.1 macrolide-specific efflux system membrane fusion protein [Azoarcus indigens]
MNKPSPPSSTKPARLRRWPLYAVVSGVVLLSGYLVWSNFLRGADPQAQYQFATVQRGDIEDVVTATGTLQPRDYVDVGAQVSGQLKKIHVEVGSEVKAGDLLAEIDPTVYLAKVDASRAQLRNLRAQLKEREAQLKLSSLQLRRQQALMSEEATTAESLQNAEASLQSSEAQLEALRAQIEQIESSLRADEANLQYARILSPMSGTVVSISARQGQTLNTNQSAPTVLRVADLNTMTVQTQVSEADVARLKVGMESYFTTLGGQGQRWYGKLEKIEPTPTVTNNVVLFNALFDVPNPDGRLMTQMTAQVFFIVASARNTLVVPMSALNVANRPPRGQGPAQGQGPGQRERPAGTGPSGGMQAAARQAGEGGRERSPRAGAAERPERGERSSEAGGERRRPSQAGAHGPRRGIVRVARADGTLEDRPVELGISNRVQVQVLSGLEEGERLASGNVIAARPQGGDSNQPPRMPPRL